MGKEKKEFIIEFRLTTLTGTTYHLVVPKEEFGAFVNERVKEGFIKIEGTEVEKKDEVVPES